MDLKSKKQALRTQLKLTLATQPPQAFQLSPQWITHLLEILQRKGFTRVAFYAGQPTEMNLRPLMQGWHEKGGICLLPIVSTARREMIFRKWTPQMTLIRNRHGIEEPPPSAEEMQPDMIFVPSLATDRTGHRLGWGGGHYDATLAALSSQGVAVSTWGIALPCQILDTLPHEPHDVPLDWVIVVGLDPSHQTLTGR